MLKRVFLFAVVNILVVVTISLSLNLLGIRPYLEGQGIDFMGLLIFCAAFGFIGAFVSLAISRWMAKFAMGVKVIDPERPASHEERELVQTVYRLARKANLPAMPEVGYYDSPELNAFATGPTKSRSLVAVSTGLLRSMDNSAVEGVLGHEVAHIANGDMVTMTLLQGVVNTFVMFFARVAAWALSNVMAGDRDNRGPSPWVYYLSTMVFEIAFSLLGMIVIAFYSRGREFRADKGGAKLAGRDKMIHALESLKRGFEGVDHSHPSIQTLKINGGKGGLMALLSTHPDLDKRISALRTAPL